jgi:hypothetical protein
MRLLRFVRRHPIAVLSVIALAFVVWVWRDAFRGPPVVAPVAQVDGEEGPFLPPPKLPVKKRFTNGDHVPPAPHGTVQVFSKLKPGMTRTEVEDLVGTPASKDIHPATIIDGRVTYHTTYEADLGPPPTVRPIRLPRPHPTEHDAKPLVVVLEFDATKPGHPLIDVHYPDPLF